MLENKHQMSLSRFKQFKDRQQNIEHRLKKI
jgi:hypothetical protein